MNNVKTKMTVIVLIIAALSIINGQTFGGRAILTGTWNGEEIEYVDGQILVRLEQGHTRSSATDLFIQETLTVVQGFDRLNIALLETESGADLFDKINILQNSPNIDFAEPNMIDHTFDYPNDPYYVGTTPADYAHHWSYHNIEQDPPSGTLDADIDAQEAWELEIGDSDVLIAVLDSGIPLENGELCHPDLNDPDRYILGPDFVGDGDGVRDGYGHGTHVTGIIAAETNNDEGVAGICWNCKI